MYTIEGKRCISYGIDYVHPQTGQRIKKILKGVSSMEKAFELRNIELADASRGAINKAYGLKGNGKPVLFENMVNAYLVWSKENKDSWQTDEHRAKPLLLAFKGKLASDINPFMAEKYKMARAKQVNKKTVNKELSFARQVFDKAIEWKKWDGGNPFAGVKFRIKKGKKPGALTPEQVLAIRDNITHPVKQDMVGFAFYAGWRISEIRKLKWDDVDLDRGTAWVVDPKSGNTVEIELDPKAVEIVSRQQKRSEFVFCHKNGKPYKTNLHDVIRNAATRAGVYLPPKKAWHIFRRTWASIMLQRGCDVETLRVLGNWKDTSMPLWYAEAAGSEQRREALSRVPDLDELKTDGRNKEEIEKVVELNNHNH